MICWEGFSVPCTKISIKGILKKNRREARLMVSRGCQRIYCLCTTPLAPPEQSGGRDLTGRGMGTSAGEAARSPRPGDLVIGNCLLYLSSGQRAAVSLSLTPAHAHQIETWWKLSSSPYCSHCWTQPEKRTGLKYPSRGNPVHKPTSAGQISGCAWSKLSFLLRPSTAKQPGWH